MTNQDPGWSNDGRDGWTPQPPAGELRLALATWLYRLADRVAGVR